MRVGGIIDISTKDIPNRSAMVILTVGCNLNCEFCPNKYLLHESVGKDMEISELLDQIKSNMLVSGVSISGGEPTLQKDLLDLCKEISKTDKYISIDTNGSNPDLLKKLVPYINRVALNLKGPLIPKNLEKITRVKVNVNKIIKTIKFLNTQKGLDFEIRTIYVGNLISPNDIQNIIEFLKCIGFKGNFVLQQYQYQEVVDERFKEIFSKPEHDALIDFIRPYKDLASSFNIFLRDEFVGYSKIEELFN